VAAGEGAAISWERLPDSKDADDEDIDLGGEEGRPDNE
jgi:hypothetical protein